ncbi:unnamed protein product [Arabis nemorensis]|uniref:F-box domain-containing protein n=1 Tax=Arabis nemorensis TaxID=586526 RepID=A0A565C2K2_9BRAS|nr:unnamed protein product [Arabis nemorensis]
MQAEEPRNWSELPSELMSSIMLRLGAFEILENAQKVCTSWRRVSKEPSLWRKIDMQNLKTSEYDLELDRMCRHAVDRSVWSKSTSATWGPILSSTTLRTVTEKGLVDTVSKLPLLEELEVTLAWLKLDLKGIGHSCPKLKTLKLNCSHYIPFLLEFNDDDDGLAIAESMPQLHHLQLIRDKLTDIGLHAILDNCPHLEHLDLRKCHINLSEDSVKRCLERVKDFRHSNCSTADYTAFYNKFRWV